ncbi:MAG: prepilin peptidase [Candidatus Micrarchaeia archaeon]
MMLQLLRVLVLVAIAVLYAVFDVFNKREIPDAFVYASLAIGALFTLTYPVGIIYESVLIAAFILGVGYVIYKAGFWGAGDFMELTALSLIMPIQPKPWFSGVAQLGIPFVVSLFISAGIAAIWIVPIYYLLIKRNKNRQRAKTQRVYKMLGVLLLAMYLMLLLFMYVLFGIGLLRLLIILIIGVPSAITLAYEEEITSSMTARVPVSRLDEGDIIAINLMNRSDIAYFKKRYPKFDRLITKEMVAKLKGSSRNLPVYKNAAPFTLFILIGAIVSFAFGNVILYLV